MKQTYIIWLLLAAFTLALPAPAEAASKPRKNTGTIVQPPVTKAKKAPAKEAPKEEIEDATPTPAPEKPAATTSSNPYESSVWSAEDVKKMCARSAGGPRAYNSCVSRNSERRIGRIKQPLDNNLIE
jgi:hypothetical protein